FVKGKVGEAVELDGKRYLDAGDVGNFGFYDRFSLAAWVYPEGDHGGTIVSRMTDVDEGDGYAVVLKKGRVQVNLVKRWLDDAVRVETDEVLSPGSWRHVLVVYDGSRVAAGVHAYLDGKPAKMRVLLDDLNQSFETKQPLRVGGGNGPDGRFRGRLNQVLVYDRALSAEDARVAAVAEEVRDICRIPAAKRTPEQAEKVYRYYLLEGAPADIRKAHARVKELLQERQRLLDSIPTTMVMQEMPRPRDAHVLIRGQYDRPGEKVQPGVPAVLSPWPAREAHNRLGLARWLVDADNPL